MPGFGQECAPKVAIHAAVQRYHFEALQVASRLLSSKEGACSSTAVAVVGTSARSAQVKFITTCIL